MPIKFSEHPRRKPTKVVRYQTRVTAFLDLLGFAQYVERTRRRGDLVDKLHRLLNVLAEFGQERFGWTRRTTSFSDSIVLSEQMSGCDINDFLGALGRLQRWMIRMELPVRGGVTVGRLFHEQGIVFGPALIQAYRLESVRAKVPRIVVAPAMVAALQEHPRARQIIRQDADGLFFIDFLSERVDSHFSADINIVELEYDSLYAMMNQYMTDARVMVKLSWLDAYYRQYVSQRHIDFRREHSPDLVPESHRKKDWWRRTLSDVRGKTPTTHTE